LTKSCPLCESSEVLEYAKIKDRIYSTCRNCFLVFLDENLLLNEEEEKKRYDNHTNSSEDLNYRKHLSKILNPMIQRVKSGASGLDFGSGPGPTLSKMFEENGFKMNIYDHFYAKDEEVLKQKYYFISSTEVIEHLYKPKEVLEGLFDILKDGGVFGVMTQLYPEDGSFNKWYYKNDPTHVSLFSLKTMEYLASTYSLSLEVIAKDIFIFTKILK